MDIYWWLSARLWYLQCISTGDTTALVKPSTWWYCYQPDGDDIFCLCSVKVVSLYPVLFLTSITTTDKSSPGHFIDSNSTAHSTNLVKYLIEPHINIDAIMSLTEHYTVGGGLNRDDTVVNIPSLNPLHWLNGHWPSGYCFVFYCVPVGHTTWRPLLFNTALVPYQFS